MADPISAGIMVGGSLLGGLFGKSSSNSAARAQERANQAAIAEQRRQFDITQQNMQPWLAAGRNALGQLSDPAKNFQTSPGYDFRRTEGQRGIGNSFAARGGAFSGNALRALTEYNQNLASGEFGNWWNQQAGLAGVGQNAANSLANAGQASANNIGSYLVDSGQARASGILGGANALSGGLSDAVNQWNYFRNPNLYRTPGIGDSVLAGSSQAMGNAIGSIFGR